MKDSCSMRQNITVEANGGRHSVEPGKDWPQKAQKAQNESVQERPSVILVPFVANSVPDSEQRKQRLCGG